MMVPGEIDSGAAEDRYEIAQIDASADRGLIRELAEHLPEDQGAEHFDKYYRDNPSGTPIVAVARVRESGKAVGMAALLMSTISVGGKAARAGVSADFAVVPEHRGLGPALRLQREALRDVGSDSLLFVYGCPNPNALPIVKRVGYTSVGMLATYVKVLRTGPILRTRVSNRALARLVLVAAHGIDPVMRLFSKETRTVRSRTLKVSRPTTFDDRFLSVWASNASEHAITGERTPELLNWRYDLGTDAEPGYAILAVEDRDDRVVGYVVHKSDGAILHVFDLVCSDSAHAIETLLAQLISDARRRRVSRIYFGCLGLSGQIDKRLRAFGFRMREDSTGLYVYPPRLQDRGLDLASADQWYFVMGDNDVE